MPFSAARSRTASVMSMLLMTTAFPCVLAPAAAFLAPPLPGFGVDSQTKTVRARSMSA